MKEEDVVIKLENRVPINIFGVPRIKKRVDELFSEQEGEIKKRFDEIKSFMTKEEHNKERYHTISYDEISEFFRIYFFKRILIKAVDEVFAEDSSNEENFNLVTHVMELLTTENLQSAIYEDPMIHAFSRVIRNFDTSCSALEACMHGGMIFSIEEEFLGKNLLKEIIGIKI